MKRIPTIILSLTLLGLLPGANARETKKLLTVNDFFGGFEGASVINPKQLGTNYFSLETQSGKTFGQQGSLEPGCALVSS